METTEKRGRGRPRRVEPLYRMPTYGNAADIEIIKALAARWGCSASAAIRRAVREAAKREKVAP